ncbi:MAG: hypothetical protein Q8S03_10350 [Brevundimonas sp.]|uniref:hypothetical protein n=1 Tax=Brevundimonas sp. TaxID=1871086 RepID=UPI0027367196|nr:hypothetical protein [Brevundimonas sp.]MDP3405080.1 hypothetical protein [Brevundimonas sp.]
MTDRPILFSGPMVRALLDGRKTQTRRIVKPQPRVHENGSYGWDAGRGARCAGLAGTHWPPTLGLDCMSPYGGPGDRLWVRETWCHADTRSGFAYCADTPLGSDQTGNGWRPSIHMPRAACRLTLNVTGIRVERLQDISEADAEAEGVQTPALVPILGAFWSSRDGYARLWNHINGPDSWSANPWVWVVTFEVADNG